MVSNTGLLLPETLSVAMMAHQLANRPSDYIKMEEEFI